ncbi:MAG TPA: hydrogenase maturation nickel metallochaperone HypA [Rhodospirillaceae bacterium]|nr:hydrogenase maturation nickel metallochaperone HypA [Magnetovibrio sp.]MBO6521076.1 hydrogenase maturation nickel metallochaperone HypA [Rhodospirillales bacterium]MDW3206145.1 hydrogenase maturation nickel metallochaperone HypA [Alphaproteobacteria bacterium]HCS70011.1 hydrogenase maturation nickel metallochaperone HypA [Rhodospirillaceae bacterium]|tara:strand:+ start:37712 stop:38089 length:378 start_codon:yes stop_codon:yes gene_type:complete
MHELGITRNIVSIVAERAAGRRVTKVVVEIGKLSAILPDAVEFCFDVCAKSTPLEGATLEIVEVMADASCRDCGEQFLLATLIEPCPKCGSKALDRKGGDDLIIKHFEFLEETDEDAIEQTREAS